MKKTQMTLLALAITSSLWLAAATTAEARRADTDPLKPVAAESAAPTQVQAEATAGTTNTITNDSTEAESGRSGRHGVHRDAVVVFGHDAELKAGEEADAVVVIGGSARIRGKVQNAVVVIGGDAIIDSDVGDAVVAILGNIKVSKGVTIRGDAVAVGGTIEAEGAKIEGHTQEVDLSGVGLKLNWLKSWFLHCALMMRPLAPQVGWVWVIAGFFFMLYLFMAALFPRPVQACVEELTQRPISTVLIGILTKLLVPVVMLILAATGVGLIVVPFAVAAMVLGAMVGKVALFEWLGLRFGAATGAATLQRPLVAFLLGIGLVTVLYMVPFVGLLSFGIFSVWGLGCAVTAAFGGLRREIPEKPAPAVAPATWPVPGGGAGGVGLAFTGNSPEATGASPSAEPGTPPQPTVAVPDLLANRKAGFWERMGAGFLDFVLVGILGAIVHGPPLAFLVALAYFAGLWAWKGTTIGGIVLGLKVVRVDGQPVTYLVAIVRALAAAFSIVVLFLGFLWIAWDSEKQGWHDRIAGTVVLRLPRGTALI